MARTFRTPSSRFLITDQAASPIAEAPEIIRDRDDALRLLRTQFSDPATLASLRQWAHDQGFFKPVGSDIFEVLATLVSARRLNLMRIRPQSHYAANAEPKPDKPDTPVTPPPKPKPKPKKKVAELVVIVKDLDGNPVKEAEVTAGKLGSMKTDENGVANYGEVEPGTYKVTAEKEGHSTERKGKIKADKKRGVSVPDGTKTTVNLVQHPQCASVSFFEGPLAKTPATRNKYFGFDHKTDMPAADPGHYWKPCPAHGDLNLPGDKLTRDGARWVSVAVGKEVELEIHFDFKEDECIPCISNSTFEVVPANVATVVTPKISAKKAVFKIKGAAAGQASLKVICDGKDIGWFHIWCQEEVTLNLDVCCLVTNRAPSTSYSMAALRAHFDDIFRQAVIKIDMRYLGDIDLTGNAALATVESQGYPATGGGRFLSKSGTPRPYDSKGAVLRALDTAASAVLAARTTGPLPRNNAYRLYWYVPTVGCSILGTVMRIGSKQSFGFRPDSATARNSCAHEFGHSLNLRHPSDGSSGPQYAGHLATTLNAACPGFPDTNTEPANAAQPAFVPTPNRSSNNVLGNDPTNLMGYWGDRPNRKPLRYHQWKAASRT